MPARVMTVLEGVADGAVIRTETYRGREYTVVPVVAIVEGVLHGANSENPEFASARAFGRFPQAWNGRPVVLNHPTISGIFVSANSPQVSEDYNMGWVFGSKIEDKKLKVEAWIDTEHCRETGGDFLDVLERLEAGEVVNVSVGAFIETIAEAGQFGGRNYSAKWDTVVPDHLAILPHDNGACSIADGCGTNRVLSAHEAGQVEGAVAIRHVSPACCDDCAHKGGDCMSTNKEGDTPPVDPQTPAETVEDTPSTQGTEPETTTPDELTAEEAASQAAAQEGAAKAYRELVEEAFAENALTVEALAPDVVLDNVYSLVYSTLPDYLNIDRWSVDIYAYTSDHVVFRQYGSEDPGLQQIAYSVASDGAVTFTGEPEPVNLMTKIMPRQTGNSGPSNMEQNTMANEVKEGTEGQEAVNTNTEAPNAAPANEGPNPAPTVQDYLANAPSEIRGVLEQGLKAHNDRRAELIAGIKANARNKFTDEQLQGFTLEQLEPLAELAEVPSYSGRVQADNLNVNEEAPKRFAEAPRGFLGNKDSGNNTAAA